MARDKQKGFVLCAPNGMIWAETFRPTREAAKGWLAHLQVEGRYRDWKWHYKNGWRCKPAQIQLIEDI